MSESIVFPTEDSGTFYEIPIEGIASQTSFLINEFLQLKAEPRFWVLLAKGCLLDGNISAAIQVLRTFRDTDCKKDLTEEQDEEERTFALSLLSDLQRQALLKADFQDRKDELESIQKTTAESMTLAKEELLPSLQQGLLLFLKGDLKLAETQFAASGQTTHQAKKNLLPHVALALSSFQSKAYSKALIYLVHVLKRLGSKRTPVEIRVMIGFCFLEMGKLTIAIKIFKRCPTSTGARYGLLISYLRKYTNQEHHRSENFSKVLELILEWISDKHQKLPTSFDTSILLLVSRMLLLKGQYKIAGQIALEVCRLADTDAILAEGVLIQGRSQQALGLFNEAMSLYSQALLLKPDLPLARYGLSQMYIDSGNVRNAATSLEQIVGLYLKESSGPELTRTASTLQHVSIGSGESSQITPHQIGDCLKLLNVLYSKLPAVASEGKETTWIQALQCQSGENKFKHSVPEDFVALAQLVKGKDQVESFKRALDLYQEQKDLCVKHNKAIEAYNSERKQFMDDRLCGPAMMPVELPSIPLQVHCNAAAAFFRQYKKREPDWKWCLDAASDNTQKALSLYEQQKPSLSKITLLFNQARILEEHARYKESITLYKTITEKVPEYLEAHVHLMNTYLKMDDVESAKAQGKESLKVFPTSPVIRDLLGAFYLQIGSYQRSKECLHSVTKGDYPNDILALVLLGILNYRTAPQDLSSSSHRERAKEHYLKALSYFRSALSLDPSCVYAAQGASAVLGQFGRSLEIPKLYEKIVDLSSHRHWASSDWSFDNPLMMPGAEVNLGHLWFLKHQYSHSVKLYQYALELYRISGRPDHTVQTLIARAQYDSHSRFEDAVKTLSCLSHFRPWDKTVKFNLALVLQGQGVHFIMRFSEPKALVDDTPLKDLRSALDKIDKAIHLYNTLKISSEEILFPLKTTTFEDQITICTDYKTKGEKAYASVVQVLKKQEQQDQTNKREWEEYLKQQAEEKAKEQEQKKQEAQRQEDRNRRFEEERRRKKTETTLASDTRLAYDTSMSLALKKRNRNHMTMPAPSRRDQSIQLTSTFMDSASNHQLDDLQEVDDQLGRNRQVERQEQLPRTVIEDKDLEDEIADEQEDGRGRIKARRIESSSDEEEAE